MEPTFFQRMNQAEPFLAIRLILLQAGLAIGLEWKGIPTGRIPEEFTAFPLSLLGVYRLDMAVYFGYPMREMIWSGDWWRLPLSIFLPPGIGWFVVALVAFIPIAKIVEGLLGRKKSLLLYLAGGAAVILTDFFSTSIITAGSLGFLFAAAGALLAKNMAERGNPAAVLQSLPPGTWMLLILVWMLSWIQAYSPFFYQGWVDYTAITIPGPSPTALMFALLTGWCATFPIFLAQRDFTLAGYGIWQNLESFKIQFILPALWGLILFSHTLYQWDATYKADYKLWKLDPELRRGDAAAQEELLKFSAKHPQDLVLAKCLAISYAIHGQHQEAKEILDAISKAVPKDNLAFQIETHFRQFRLANLNWRSQKDILPFRYSGFTNNYSIDPIRLAWDQAHVVRLSGATAELEAVQNELLHMLDNYMPLEKETAADDKPQNPAAAEAKKKKRESLILNHRAYVRGELRGDLSAAIQEASASVALSPYADNLDTLGWVEARRGNYAEAIKHLEKALLYNEPSSAGTISFHLGWACWMTGDTEKAKRHFADALKYDVDWWDELEMRDKCPECLKR